MLKSSNLNSIIANVDTEAIAVSRPVDSLALDTSASTQTPPPPTACTPQTPSPADVAHGQLNNTPDSDGSTLVADQQLEAPTMASVQLAAGVLQIYEPPLLKARSQLKELIGKQNKIYIDLSAEKFKLDNADISNLHEMMNSVKVYREKLIRIKKQMQSIYQRTKVLKKRATNIESCKQKELQRKLQKQKQEESLIGKQQQL